MAYRSGKSKAVKAPETGLVQDMVRQFADPYAFLRELVQNSIDAGASRITVAIEAGEDDTLTTVRDDGSGMTRDVVESALLTLFSSTKEGDESKVGKYGVGFISVFALQPSTVRVDTWCDSEAWSIELKPDHSWKLRKGRRRKGSGTVVTLFQQLDADAVSEHRTACERSLMRWCRHAEVPIFLVDKNARKRRKMNRELTVDALVSVTEHHEGATYVVGLTPGAEGLSDGPDQIPDGADFAGFYNRGLTLYESRRPTFEQLEDVRFKVRSPKLAHTLSRDNVRRDKHWRKTMRRVSRLAKRELRRALFEELEQEAVRAGETRYKDRYELLARAGLAERIKASKREFWVPLAAPLDGEVALKWSTINRKRMLRSGLLYSPWRTGVCRELARRGVPVIWASPELVHSMNLRFGEQGIDLTFGQLTDVADSYGLLEPTAHPTPVETRLGAAITELLQALEVPVMRVEFGRIEGASSKFCALTYEHDETPLLSARKLRSSSRRLSESRVLFFDNRSEPGKAALSCAEEDLSGAAALLLRYAWVESWGPLNAEQNDRLLSHQLGVSL